MAVKLDITTARRYIAEGGLVKMETQNGIISSFTLDPVRIGSLAELDTAIEALQAIRKAYVEHQV